MKQNETKPERKRNEISLRNVTVPYRVLIIVTKRYCVEPNIIETEEGLEMLWIIAGNARHGHVTL